jgi:hypothetical protein
MWDKPAEVNSTKAYTKTTKLLVELSTGVTLTFT